MLRMCAVAITSKQGADMSTVIDAGAEAVTESREDNDATNDEADIPDADEGPASTRAAGGTGRKRRT